MSDTWQHEPQAETPVDDVEMSERVGDVLAGADDTNRLSDIEPETPKLVLFAE